MILFFPYLLLTLAVLTVAYGTGRLLLGRAAETDEPYFGVLLAMVAGLSILVGVYAAIRTGGHTVLLPVPVLLGWLLWKQRGSVPARGPVVPRALGHVLLAGVAVYTVRFLLFYDSDSSFLITPFQDYVFYARVSLALNKVGIESTMLESVFPRFVGAQPYHYYELWLNALLTWATDWSALWCLCLSTYSVLLTLVLLGLRALVAHYKLAAFWAWGLTALLFLSGGVNWPVFAQYPFTRVGRLLAGSYVAMEPKLASITLFMALSALLLVRRRYDLAGLVLAVIPLVYVSTGLAIGGSVFVLAVYLWLSRRATPVQVLLMLGPVVLAVSYFGLFYMTQPAPFQLAEAGKTLAEEVMPRVAEARTLLNVFIGLLVLYVLYFGLPLVACALVVTRATWLRWRQELVPTLWWMGTCVLLAAVGYTLATHFIDGFQFSGNIMGALLPVALAVVLGAGFGLVGTGRRVGVLVLLAVAALVNYYPLFRHKVEAQAATVYSPEFLRQVQQALPDTEVWGGFLFQDKDYQSTYMLSEDTYSAGTYLAGLTNRYDLMSLSIFAVDSLTTDPRYQRDSVQARQRLHNASLYRYARLRPAAIRLLPADSLPYRFVKQYGLAFICASPGAVMPEDLRPLVKKEIVDPRSGERFYVLK